MDFNATFIIAGLSFIIFTLIMNSILYQPISDIIEKRQAYLDANSGVTKDNLDNAQKIKDKISDEIVNSQSEAKKVVQSEVNLLKQNRQQKENDKKAEMTENIKNEKNKLAQEKTEASKQLEANVDELSNSIIARFIGGQS